MKHNMIKCSRCKYKFRQRGSVMFKKNRYCKACYITVSGRIRGFLPGALVMIEDAVKKVRHVPTYIKGGSKACVLSLPSCYSEKKVRVIIVEEGEE